MDKTHFWIPKKHVSAEKIKPHGGGKTYSRDDFGAHGKKLSHAIDRVLESSKHLRDESDLDRYIMQIESPKDFNIKNTTHQLKDLNVSVISFSKTKKNLATITIPKPDIEIIRERIERYSQGNNPYKSMFSGIDKIHSVPLQDKVDSEQIKPGGIYKCIISFYSILSPREKQKALEKVVTALRDADIGNVKSDVLIDGSTFVSAELPYRLIELIGADFLSVSSIVLDSAVVFTESAKGDAIPANLQIEPLATKAIVGVVDTGVSSACLHLHQFVRATYDHLPTGSTGPELSHGTLVASRVVYGDALERKLLSGPLKPICRIVDIQIAGLDSRGKSLGLSESDLLKVFDQMIPQIEKDVKIYNLSFGLQSNFSSVTMSRLAQFLDSLSLKYGVIFVKSAGNLTSPLPFPDRLSASDAMLTPPGEALHAITVGSMAEYADTQTLSAPNSLSPFSRRGPGYNDSIKPEIVEHGGNLLTNGKMSPRFSVYGFHHDGQSLAYNVGTSFAAPVVSNYLALLSDHFDSFDPNLLKASLFHFADPIAVPTQVIPPLFLTGFGRPNLNRVYSSDGSSVAFFHTGEIDPNYYQWIAFHVPSCFSTEKGKQLEISFTIVYNPPVDTDSVTEYSKTRISCQLSKNTLQGLKIVASTNDDETSVTAWNPVIKYKHKFVRNFASGEWRLRLRLFSRKIQDASFKQRYAIVIEVKDAKLSGNIHATFISEYAATYLPIPLPQAA